MERGTGVDVCLGSLRSAGQRCRGESCRKSGRSEKRDGVAAGSGGAHGSQPARGGRKMLSGKEKEARQEDSPTALTASYLLAVAVRRQGRREDACELYETALRMQETVLGADHEDVKQTARSLASLGREMAWNTCLDAQATPEQRQRAIELAQRAAELVVPHGPWWLVGLAKQRAGDAEGGVAEMIRSLSADESWIGQFLVMAMVQWENGDRQAAVDWFAAAADSELLTYPYGFLSGSWGWTPSRRRRWVPGNLVSQVFS